MLDIFDIMTTIHSEGGIGMGKVVEKIKVINVFESERAIEIEAVVDTGATMLVLPQNVIDKLHLKDERSKSKICEQQNGNQINLWHCNFGNVW